MRKKLKIAIDVLLYISVILITALLLMGKMRPTLIMGESMEPTLHEGELRLIVAEEPEVGDIAVFKQDGKLLVKRVEHITESGMYWMLGDNKERSVDSRYFGYIHKSAIVGKLFAPFA